MFKRYFGICPISGSPLMIKRDLSLKNVTIFRYYFGSIPIRVERKVRDL